MFLGEFRNKMDAKGRIAVPAKFRGELGDSVIMKTEVVGDASIEVNSAIAISTDFRKIFRRNLEIL